MAIGGWAEGGASQLGRSIAFDNLPWDGYRETSDWLEQWIDALGLEIDTLYQAFCTTSARSNLLDPTWTPTDSPNTYQATSVAAPTRSKSQDTMLDLMVATSGVPWPVSGNITVAQKQGLVIAAREAFKRKGTRIYWLYLASQLTDGVIYGWTVPPFTASLILPDGAPSPGYGVDWVPAAAATSASFRSWLFAELRRITTRIFPAWSTQGIGYSQFRAGYSAAGEPVMPSGARLNALKNEHFSDWTGVVPDNWTTAAASATLVQYTNADIETNWEFTSNCAQIYLVAAAAGTTRALAQSAVINNQLTHRFQLDYHYVNAATQNQLNIEITDVNANGTTYYWNPSPVLQTGTIAITEGLRTVTGTSTAFDTTGVWVGMRITTALGKVYHIASVESATSLTLKETPKIDEATALYYVTAWQTTTPYLTAPVCTGTLQLGTVALTAASGTAVGTNTQFTSDMVGKWFRVSPSSQWYFINAVASATSMTIETAAGVGTATTTESGAWYLSGRVRYACDVIPQSASASSLLYGTSSIAVNVFATSDGTLTTQQRYTLFRVGLYEKFDITAEVAAAGERSLWMPLHDAYGLGSFSRSGGSGNWVAAVNASRSAVHSMGSATPDFPWHPALNGTGYRSMSSATWANKVTLATPTAATWTFSNSSVTSTMDSPILPANATTANVITATATSAYTQIANLVADPSSKIYVAGCYVKKTSADSNFTDVRLSLLSGTSVIGYADHTLTLAEGWKLLTLPSVTFGAGDVNDLRLRISWGAASTSGVIGAYAPYVYDVTASADVLYPPIVVSNNTNYVTKLRALSDTVGTNINHPRTQRVLGSPTRGALQFTFVPTFGRNATVPNGVLFDMAKDATHDRVVLRVATNALELRRWDDAAQNHAASLTLSALGTPGSGYMTWQRDTAITIRCIWDERATYLSAGNGNASQAVNGGWAVVDTGVVAIGIGNDYAVANSIDGHFRDVQLIQIGAPG